MKLGARLEAVLSAVPTGSAVADVGTDHGKLSLELLRRKVATRVIATDVSAPSLDKARRLISSTEYAGYADFRHGDGLSVIREAEVDVVVISGMGGKEISKIVTAGPKFPYYVLSPQRDMDSVRRVMSHLGYTPQSEVTVKEDGKFYFVMTFAVGSCVLTDDEVFFGRHNLLNPSPEFIEYLDQKAHEYEVISSENPGVSELTQKANKYRQVYKALNEGK